MQSDDYNIELEYLKLAFQSVYTTELWGDQESKSPD